MFYSVKKHFKISSKEWFGILLTSIFGGFFLAFREWGEPFSFTTGIQNTFLSILLVFLLLTFMVSIIKFAGVYFGFDVVYKPFLYGLLICLVITFVSNGRIPFFFPGYFSYNIIEHLRMGKWRGGFKSWELFMTISSGILLTLFLTLIFKPLFITTEYLLFKKLFLYSIYVSMFSLIPFPVWRKISYLRFYKNFEAATPGADLFIYGRFFTVFLAAYMVFFTILVLLSGPLPFILSLVFALIILFIYSRLFERSP